jgi:hypothetical protein
MKITKKLDEAEKLFSTKTPHTPSRQGIQK